MREPSASEEERHMSDELSDAAKAAIQRADKREGEIRVADLRGAPIRGLGPVPPSRAVPAARAARERVRNDAGFDTSPDPAERERRFGRDYRRGT
jgi:hypothetical protein